MKLKKVKPIKTDFLANLCKCGKVVTLKRFDAMKEFTSMWDGERAYMAFCKCGKVYLAHHEIVENF